VIGRILAYRASAPEHVFMKWVTRNRQSPRFAGVGGPLTYKKGAVIEERAAIISDRICAPGIHVLRPGCLPEHAGLCGPGHDLIGLRVLVRSEDICCPGFPGNDDKLRVSRVKVLD